MSRQRRPSSAARIGHLRHASILQNFERTRGWSGGATRSRLLCGWSPRQSALSHRRRDFCYGTHRYKNHTFWAWVRIPQSALSSFFISLALCTWALISLSLWYQHSLALGTGLSRNPSAPKLIPPCNLSAPQPILPAARPPCNPSTPQPARPAARPPRSPPVPQPARPSARIPRNSFAPQPVPPRSSSAPQIVNSTKERLHRSGKQVKLG